MCVYSVFLLLLLLFFFLFFVLSPFLVVFAILLIITVCSLSFCIYFFLLLALFFLNLCLYRVSFTRHKHTHTHTHAQYAPDPDKYVSKMICSFKLLKIHCPVVAVDCSASNVKYSDRNDQPDAVAVILRNSEIKKK